jgi:pimeloyl-ACP methyl ester carboxylesterase
MDLSGAPSLLAHAQGLAALVFSQRALSVDETRKTRVVIVPGLAVRSYAADAASALEQNGFSVTLLPAPAWRGVPKLLKSYGSQLAGRLDRAGDPVDLLIGLSVGTQAAAVAAAESGTVQRLLLISPMVDPADCTFGRLLAAWLFRKQKGDSGFSSQLPDWTRAGVPRILAGFLSALDVKLEDVLPAFHGALTIVQPAWNTLSSSGYAEQLAGDNDGQFIRMPGAAHSWPIGDPIRFVRLVSELTGGETA